MRAKLKIVQILTLFSLITTSFLINSYISINLLNSYQDINKKKN